MKTLKIVHWLPLLPPTLFKGLTVADLLKVAKK